MNQEIRENRLENIFVCTVMPTVHDTPFFDHAATYTGHRGSAHEELQRSGVPKWGSEGAHEERFRASTTRAR